MKITKRLTFSDVNAGVITIAPITTNAPTSINAKIYPEIDFNGSNLTFAVGFDPAVGGDRTLTKTQIENLVPGYEYSLESSPDTVNPSGIYTGGDGDLKVSITASSAPTQGTILLVVDIEVYPVS